NGRSASCVIVNMPTTGTGPPKTASSATLTVYDDSAAPIEIAVSCDSGAVAKTPLPASTGSPARFSISGFTSGAICLAAENQTPSGYSADATNCRRVTITNGGSSSCKISETQNSATLTVNINFTDGNPAQVYVTLACPDGGTVSSASPSGGSSQLASSSSPAEFTISGFPTGATCSASEDKVSSRYTQDESDCQKVPLTSKKECTMVNSTSG